MDQRDSHCPYSLSSEITAKLTVLEILVCTIKIVSHELCFFSTRILALKTFTCYVQRRGKKTLLSLTLVCYCHLVGMAKIVRGSTFSTTMKHRYLAIWLTYCTVALPLLLCLKDINIILFYFILFFFFYFSSRLNSLKNFYK